jgi:hypothetical protein
MPFNDSFADPEAQSTTVVAGCTLAPQRMITRHLYDDALKRMHQRAIRTRCDSDAASSSIPSASLSTASSDIHPCCCEACEALRSKLPSESWPTTSNAWVNLLGGPDPANAVRLSTHSHPQTQKALPRESALHRSYCLTTEFRHELWSGGLLCRLSRLTTTRGGPSDIWFRQWWPGLET